MNTTEFEKIMTSKYGYRSYYESGVLMFTGPLRFDVMQKDIKEKAAKLDYKGSWGVKGFPKGAEGRMLTPAPEEKDEPVKPDEEEEIVEEPEDSGTVDNSDEDVTDDTSYATDDFGQITFNFD